MATLCNWMFAGTDPVLMMLIQPIEKADEEDGLGVRVRVWEGDQTK